MQVVKYSRPQTIYAIRIRRGSYELTVFDEGMAIYNKCRRCNVIESLRGSGHVVDDIVDRTHHERSEERYCRAKQHNDHLAGLDIRDGSRSGWVVDYCEDRNQNK